MKIVSVIEARMTSSRLPGKVLLEACGVPLLHHLITRLRAVDEIDEIVIATTTNATDDVLEKFAIKERVGIYRGSEDDVLGRVAEASAAAKADVVVEITGDCPILDPDITSQVIRTYLHHQGCYVSNNHFRTYPDGMDTRVFPLAMLQRSGAMTDAPLDREHVTLHIRNNPELFRHVHVIAPPSQHWPGLGLTLDEEADYQLIRRLIEHFQAIKPLFGCRDVVELLREHPDWVSINDAVKRKGDT
jgi:spore coat polysaccharide biosynthesis protein SpsF